MIPVDVAFAVACVPGGKYARACLTVDEGLLSLQATDGFVLIEVTWEDTTYSDLVARIGFTTAELESIARGEEVAGTEDFEFPALKDVENIWSKTKKLHTAPWGVSAQKLSKLLQVLMDLGVTEEIPVRMLMDGPQASLHLDVLDLSGGLSVRAAVAPMRI